MTPKSIMFNHLLTAYLQRMLKKIQEKTFSKCVLVNTTKKNIN